MKRLLQVLSTSVFSICLMTGMAGAATVTCGSISNTGPNSNNKITCVDENDVKVKCENNVTVKNTNDQDADSGDAFTVDNTTAGGSTSGDATNSNKTVVKLNVACAPVQTAVSNTPNQPAGGMGAGAAQTPASAAPQAAPAGGAGAGVAALPETGSNTALDTAVVGAAVIGGTMAVSQLGVLAYRRFALK